MGLKSPDEKEKALPSFLLLLDDQLRIPELSMQVFALLSSPVEPSADDVPPIHHYRIICHSSVCSMKCLHELGVHFEYISLPLFIIAERIVLYIISPIFTKFREINGRLPAGFEDFQRSDSSIDYYMSPPIPGLDLCYSSFQGGKVNEVPVIRVYVSTPAGHKTCLHIHPALPYLYVPCSDIVHQPDHEGDVCALMISLALERALKVFFFLKNVCLQDLMLTIVSLSAWLHRMRLLDGLEVLNNNFWGKNEYTDVELDRVREEWATYVINFIY
ncbi:unnamed protein product [Lactuca virosa]|uniref:DNA polymerase zeta catalytic subunit N-terminal domain-containing protein n=1 Tax=Lactuca virosa TaxID=75947 RepID=A0AAU9MD42_9ASTR|nr:unnamed protein product [Lactuca virosa]